MNNVAHLNDPRPSDATLCLRAAGQTEEQQRRAWTVLDLETHDDPAELGPSIRTQVAWLSLFERQTAAGHHLKDVDTEGSIDELPALAGDVDALAMAYEFGFGRPFIPHAHECGVPTDASSSLGMTMRKLSARAVRSLERYAATGKRPASFRDTLLWLTTISLEVDTLASHLGSEPAAVVGSDDSEGSTESHLDAAAE